MERWVRFNGYLLFKVRKRKNNDEVFVKYYEYLSNGRKIKTRKLFKVINCKVYEDEKIVIYDVKEEI